MGQNSYSADSRAFVITDEGKTTVFKQDSGIMLANIGFVLVRDNKDWLKKYVRGVNPTGDLDPKTMREQLSKLTFGDILKHCTVIFRSVSYDYDSNQFRPNEAQYTSAVDHINSHCFPIYFSYNRYKPDEDVKEDEPMERTYISYDAYIQPGMGSIANVTGDMSFDAIIYFAWPFKPEEQNRWYGDPQTAAMFAINYFDDDKVMILKDQNKRLIMNIEIHYYLKKFEASKVTFTEYEPFSLHLVNNKVTNTQLKDANTFSTTDNLLIK